jgi:taurine dioxygenase
MKTHLLTGTFGIEVTDVDLRTEINEVNLVDLWLEHRVVVVRGQVLDTDDQINVARSFGQLGEIGTATAESTYYERHVMHVGNVDLEDQETVLKSGEMNFHYDTCYFPIPYGACLLYGIEVTSSGGQTLFADAVSAFKRLSPDLQRRVVNLMAENAYDYSDSVGVVHRKAPGPDAKRARHPVGRLIPDTGEPALFVNRLMTHRIVGLDEEKSESLLVELFEALEDPAYQYAHTWQEGDLVIWDNRCVLHARSDFDPNERRHLRRVSVIGEVPLPFEF